MTAWFQSVQGAVTFLSPLTECLSSVFTLVAHATVTLCDFRLNSSPGLSQNTPNRPGSRAFLLRVISSFLNTLDFNSYKDQEHISLVSPCFVGRLRRECGQLALCILGE